MTRFFPKSTLLISLISIYFYIFILSNAVNSENLDEYLKVIYEEYHSGKNLSATHKLIEHLSKIKGQNNDPIIYKGIIDLTNYIFNIGDASLFDLSINLFKNSIKSDSDDKSKPLYEILTDLLLIKKSLLIGDFNQCIENGNLLLNKLNKYKILGDLFYLLKCDISTIIGSSLLELDKLREAEPYLYQALLYLNTQNKYSYPLTLKLFDSLLKFYVKSNNLKYLNLLHRELLQNSEIIKNYGIFTIESISFHTSLVEAMLIVGYYDKQDILNFINLISIAENKVEFLPATVKLNLSKLKLYHSILSYDANSIKSVITSLESYQITNSKNCNKSYYDILSLAHLNVSNYAKADFYNNKSQECSRETHLPDDYINLYVKASLLGHSNNYMEGYDIFKKAIINCLGSYIKRLYQFPNDNLSLDMMEDIVTKLYLTIFLKETSIINNFPKEDQEIIASVIQFIQNAQFISGARISEYKLVADNDNVREHLRVREKLDDIKFEHFKEALTNIFNLYNKNTPIILENQNLLNRLNISYRLNNIDKYLMQINIDKIKRNHLINTVNLSDLQNILKDDEVIISHFNIWSNQLAIECITKNSYNLITREFSSNSFYNNVKLLNMSLTREGVPDDELDSQFPVNEAIQIYNTLIDPIYQYIKNKKKILIASTDDFFLVPFNSLLMLMPEKTKFGYNLKKSHWLSNHFSISIILSKAMFFQNRLNKNKLRDPDIKLLAFGNPLLSESNGNIRNGLINNIFLKRGLGNKENIQALPSLPDSKDEIENLVKIIGGKSSHVYLDRFATENNLRSLDLNRYRIIAFATHGISPNEIEGVGQPALILTPISDTDSRNDGLLTISEISKMSIGAYLIILSACNTAGSDGSQLGKTFSGLANSFLIAGGKSILATQWSIVSFVSNELISNLFYQVKYNPEITLSEALKEAMLVFRRNNIDSMSHPRFWAPFLIVGDGGIKLKDIIEVGVNNQIKSFNTNWELNLQENYKGEINSIAKGENGNIYFYGIAEFNLKIGRTNSILGKIDSFGNLLWKIEENNISGNNDMLKFINNNLIYSGTVKAKNNLLGAKLKSRDINSNLLWEIYLENEGWTVPIGIAKLNNNNILWVVYQTKSAPTKNKRNNQPVDIIVYTINQKGEVLSKIIIPIDNIPNYTTYSKMVLQNNEITIAFKFPLLINNENLKDKLSYDNETGYMQMCINEPKSLILRIDINKGVLVYAKMLNNILINNLRIKGNGNIIAAIEGKDNCSVEGDAAIIEIDNDLKLNLLANYTGPIGKTANDLELLPDGKLLMIGNMLLVFEPEIVEIGRNERGYEPNLSGEFFKNDKQVYVAFLAIFSEDGKLLFDKTFGDMRGRSFQKVILSDEGKIISGGAANGTSNWLISINPPSFN